VSTPRNGAQTTHTPSGARDAPDWLCIGRRLPPVEVATPAAAVDLGPELPLKLHQAPDHGAIADQTCSATTLRRRRDEWIILGLADRLRLAVLGAYDRLFGLELEYLAVDGCITKAPCGGQTAGPSPWTVASKGSSAPR
jgi:hypothetical protein